MGRKATCYGEWPGGAGEVHALLETYELILRGECRERLPLTSLSAVAVDGGALTFNSDAGRFALHLGTAAASWATKIATPLPTLAAKLGIVATTRVHVVGEVDDAALQAAIDAGTSAGPMDADLTIALITDLAMLDRASTATATPLWLAYVKGVKSPCSDGAIRTAMRARGWTDVKVASVSDRLTATKYVYRPLRQRIPPSAIAPCAAPVSGTTSPLRSLISSQRAAIVSGVISSGATWMPRVSVT